MSVAVVNAASMQPDEIFYDITKHCNTPLLFAESFFNLALKVYSGQKNEVAKTILAV